MNFKFRNSYKKRKKKKAHLFGVFRFYVPCAKKDKNAKKKVFFLIRKIHIEKKIENNISKKRCKKTRNAKKDLKKSRGGVYFFRKPFEPWSFFFQ